MIKTRRNLFVIGFVFSYVCVCVCGHKVHALIGFLFPTGGLRFLQEGGGGGTFLLRSEEGGETWEGRG